MDVEAVTVVTVDVVGIMVTVAMMYYSCGCKVTVFLVMCGVVARQRFSQLPRHKYVARK